MCNPIIDADPLGYVELCPKTWTIGLSSDFSIFLLSSSMMLETTSLVEAANDVTNSFQNLAYIIGVMYPKWLFVISSRF